jgi:hypothetical protein
MEDIVSRLRTLNFMGPWQEAADEIERLREALQYMIRWHDQLSPADIAKAKAALEKSND